MVSPGSSQRLPTPPLPTLEVRIGEAACLRGSLKKEELDAAVAEQALDRAEGKPERTLGDILVARGTLSESEWRSAADYFHREQAERAAAVEERAGDNLIGRLLCHRGWTTEAQIAEALKLQAAMAAKGQRPVPRLGTILVELGYLSHEHADMIPGLERRAVLFCPACGRRVEVAGYEAGKAYRCPQCSEPLRTPPGDLLADERAVGPDLLLDHPLPREVEAVIDDHTRTFGKYHLIDVLGRGGMAIVYRAWDPGPRRFVALKVFDPGEEKADDKQSYESDLKRFIREGRTASRLNHPNIVTVYEAGVEKGRYYIVMEHIAGATLEGIIRESARPVWRSGAETATYPGGAARETDKDAAAGDARGVGHLPPRRTAELVRDIALAVHYAHRHGILHRDLKPQNILIDPAGQPHITDFGIALDLRKRRRFTTTTDSIPRLEPPTLDIPTIGAPGIVPDIHPAAEARDAGFSSSLTVDGFVVGTPAYMSPEQLRGERDLDARTDVYGLGAILYETLTGRAPFVGESVDQTISLVLETPLVPPREVVRDLHSPDLEAICLKALTKDRSQRYEAALDMAQDLERFLRGEPVAARVTRGAREAVPTARKASSTYFLVAVLAVEAAVIAALVGRIFGWW